MRRRRILTVLIVLTLAFIWGNSLLSRERSAAVSNRVMDWMNEAGEALGLGEDFFTFLADDDGDGVLERSSYLVRKLAHVTEYAVLGALLWLRLETEGARRFFTAWGLAALTGAMDETLQIFSHRGNQLRDVGIDSAGALLGLGLAALLTWLHHNRKAKRERGG